MRRWQRRFRSVLDRQFVVVVSLLLVATLAGGWATYQAYGQTHTEIQERPGPEAQYTGVFNHSADVVVNTPVFPNGTTLSNRQTYFTSATPVLDGQFEYMYTATETGNVTAVATVLSVFRSVAQGDRESEYWRVTRPLNSTRTSLRSGETLRLGFSANATELAADLRQYDESIGRSPGTLQVTIVANVRTTGTVNGQTVDRTHAYEMGVEPGGNVYRVADPGAVTNTTTQTRMVRVRTEPSTLTRFGGPLSLTTGLLSLVVLSVLRYQGRLALTEVEQVYVAYESDRAEYEDWITTARLPPEARDGPIVEVDSLEGLVDIAIDSDRRVLRNGADQREYVTVVDGTVYQFVAPPEPDAVALSPRVVTTDLFGGGQRTQSEERPDRDGVDDDRESSEVDDSDQETAGRGANDNSTVAEDTD